MFESEVTDANSPQQFRDTTSYVSLPPSGNTAPALTITRMGEPLIGWQFDTKAQDTYERLHMLLETRAHVLIV